MKWKTRIEVKTAGLQDEMEGAQRWQADPIAQSMYGGTRKIPRYKAPKLQANTTKIASALDFIKVAYNPTKAFSAVQKLPGDRLSQVQSKLQQVYQRPGQGAKAVRRQGLASKGLEHIKNVQIGRSTGQLGYGNPSFR